MSNIIPFSATGNSEVPAHLAALFGDESNIAPRMSINQLSYKGKVWRRIVDGEESQLTRKSQEGDTEPVPIVSVVVLDHNKGRSRAFYEGAYTEGENKAPTCSSMDGVKPDASIAEPVCATCAACPNAVKGSKITENNKQTTLCSPFKRVAVVPSVLSQIGKHPALLLRLAQTSVWDKNNPQEAQGWYAWDQYLDMLRARGAKHTAAVETRVKFDLDKAYPKLLFSASRWLNPEEAAAAKARLASSADEISKILNGAGQDGVAGSPGIPAEGVSEAAAATQPAGPSAEEIAAAEAEKKALAVAAAEAEKKAAKAAAAKAAKAAQAAAEKAAQEAAAAAAAASAGDDGGFGGGDDDGGFGGGAAVAEKPVAAVQTAAPAAASPAAAVETGTPAGLADLLNGWDA